MNKRTTLLFAAVIFCFVSSTFAADEVSPAIGCPENAVTHTVKTDGVGYGSTKSAALDAARAQADAKGQLLPTCPAHCTGSATPVDPPYDSSVPSYAPYGNGFQCKVERTQTITMTCKG